MALAPVLGSLRRSRKVAIDFGLRIAQIHRIEVELHEVEQRQSGDRHRQRAGDDQNPMPLEEMIDRRQERIPHRLALAGRVEKLQQRRQHRDARDERNQHARAGDLAELRDALVVGRQEAQKSGRGRHRGKRQRHGGAPRGLLQGLRQVIVLEALGAVANAELNPEIDARGRRTGPRTRSTAGSATPPSSARPRS